MEYIKVQCKTSSSDSNKQLVETLPLQDVFRRTNGWESFEAYLKKPHVDANVPFHLENCILGCKIFTEYRGALVEGRVCCIDKDDTLGFPFHIVFPDRDSVDVSSAEMYKLLSDTFASHGPLGNELASSTILAIADELSTKVFIPPRKKPKKSRKRPCELKSNAPARDTGRAKRVCKPAPLNHLTPSEAGKSHVGGMIGKRLMTPLYGAGCVAALMAPKKGKKQYGCTFHSVPCSLVIIGQDELDSFLV